MFSVGRLGSYDKAQKVPKVLLTQQFDARAMCDSKEYHSSSIYTMYQRALFPEFACIALQVEVRQVKTKTPSDSVCHLKVERNDLDAAELTIGDFGGDNRAGVPGTLHRISAIRNRKGLVVGLTCRVGRAITGHIDMIRDILGGTLLTTS